MPALRNIPLEQVQPGTVLGADLHAVNGNVLLQEGTVLTEKHICSLNNYMIDAVPVRPEVSETCVVPESPVIDWKKFAELKRDMTPVRARQLESALARKILDAPPKDRNLINSLIDCAGNQSKVSAGIQDAELLRRQAIEVCRNTFVEIAEKREIDVKRLRRLSRLFIDKGLDNPFVFPVLLNLRNYDDHLIDHSVKTSIYSLMIGARLGMDGSELAELFECALLHDVGMIHVPEKVWKKKGPLEVHEQLEMQKHVIYGADMLHDVKNISPWADIVAYQHHERFDGSGYPKERKGRAICEFARIVGLADHYAACTAPRPFRERLHGYKVMTNVLSELNGKFDAKVVRAFLMAMGLYPVGNKVELSDGRKGLVVAAHPTLSYRSSILIDGDEFSQREIIDLAKTPNISIARAA